MENIRNNEPSTPDSSYETNNFSSDTGKKTEPEPKIDPEEVDNLVRQFEYEANERLHCVNRRLH